MNVIFVSLLLRLLSVLAFNYFQRTRESLNRETEMAALQHSIGERSEIFLQSWGYLKLLGLQRVIWGSIRTDWNVQDVRCSANQDMQAAIRLYLTAKRRLLVRDENIQVNSAIFLGGGRGGDSCMVHLIVITLYMVLSWLPENCDSLVHVGF